MTAYAQYIAGNLQNYELTDEDVQKNISELEKII